MAKTAAKKKAPAKTAKAAKPAKTAAKKTAAAKPVKAAKAPAKSAAKPTAKAAAATPSKGYKIGVGKKAPAFDLPATSGKQLALGDFSGRLVVLYFYPKDSTPGCTLEGHDFKKHFAEFQRVECDVIGVSKDSVRSHENFKMKCQFPFELVSDETGDLCNAFDVIQMKNMYGRKFEGIERSTFVLGRDGTILREWRKVKVDGHAREVLGFVKSKA